MSRRNIVVIALIVSVFFIFAGSPSQALGVSMSEAVMCSRINAVTKEPLERRETFSLTEPEIFCSVKLSNATDTVTVTARWIYLKGEIAGLENKRLVDFSLDAEGTRYLGFSLVRPVDGWVSGNYEVVLLLDSVEQSRLTFDIR